MRLGKLPARRDTRTLRLSRYLGADIQEPRRIDWSLGVNDWNQMLNDQIGSCAIAGPGHWVQAWTNNNGNEVVIPDGEILKAYSAVGGYIPGNPWTDNGCIMLDVMNYWRRNGIGGHKINSYAAVNPSNRHHTQLAVDLFGGVLLGIELPQSIKSQEVWSVPDAGLVGPGKVGSLGGHCVVALNYGPTGLVVVTWGQLVTLTWEFIETYTSEVFVALSDDWVNGTKAAPNGFGFAQLQADLRLVAG